MNVALFASAFHPYVGGVEEHCRQLAHELERQGHRPIVLTNRWPRSMPSKCEVEGIPVYRLAFRVPEGSAKAVVSYQLTHHHVRRQVLSILKLHAIDVLHVHCVSANAYYARMAKQMLNLPLIVSTHGEVTMDATQLFQRSTFMNQVLRDAIGVADAVTACSRKALNDLVTHLGDEIKCHCEVVYNGIRVEDFAKTTRFAHPRPYILGLGRFVKQKGFDVLLQAFALLPNSSPDLVLAGDGDEEPSLRELAVSLGVGHRVRFTGRADRPMAVSLFQGCEFFVLPSREEPMGIVNLEAMAAGKAVIASRVGGVPEVISEGVTGLFVKSDDPSALAEAINKLISEPDLRDRLGNAGIERASRFTWTRTTEQYVNLYQGLAQRLPQVA